MSKRILLVNKFYYNRRGDCVATITLEHLLQAHGYEVAVFDMAYHDNFNSPYSKHDATENRLSEREKKGKHKT